MTARTLATVVACGVLVGLAGCGSSASTSSRSSASSPTGTSGAASTSTKAPAQSRSTATTSGQPTTPSSASAAPAAQPASKSAKQSTVTRAYGSVATFGHQASAGDRASVVAAFHSYLSAIAAGDWTAACGELSTPVKHQLQALPARAGGGTGRCAAALGALLGRVPSSARRMLAQADVISVRTDGDRAFILYRSASLSHASISMFREAGRWTAGVLSATLTG
jgi:hypothetical protein